MAGPLTDGQALVGPIANAVAALLRGEDADVDVLLPAWRALAPACHPGAGRDEVDVAALAAVLGRHPDLLADVGSTAGRPIAVVGCVDDDPRGGPPAAAVARMLADVLVLRLESRKIAHGLPAPAPALRAVFPDPDTARRVLAAVRDLPGLAVAPAAPPATDGLLDALTAPGMAGRAVHIAVGGSIRRLLDLLSPYGRRLRVDLALAGRAAGAVPDDDDVYRGLARLAQQAPETISERRAVDAAEGFFDCNAGFVLDTSRLVEDLVDRRVRTLVPTLQRARLVLVGVVDARAVRSLPGIPASTHVLVDDDADRAPGALLDGATGAVLPIAGAGASALSLPWRGLAPTTADGAPVAAVDEGSFAALQALWRRRVDAPDVPPPGVIVDRDPTRAAMQLLATLLPSRPRRPTS
jgi:hypothetical protein